MVTLLKKMMIAGCALLISTSLATARESYSWKTFKGNLDANGIDALLPGTVFVGFFQDQNRPDIKQRDSVVITAFGKNGVSHGCHWLNDTEDFTSSSGAYRGGTFTQANRIRLDIIGVGEVDSTEDDGGSIPIYHGKNGSFKTFIFHKRKWWENLTGHLQEAIPAVTYELCPDFPKASKLGFEVNEHQTAMHYTEMMKQHPGVRIFRPDLITEDTKVTWERGESEPPLTRGYWNAFSEHPCFGCGQN